MYWDETSRQWSRDGCEREASNDTTIVCRCTHLTDFSLIVGYKTDQDDPVLNYISYGVCGASVLALIITQIIKHCVK